MLKHNLLLVAALSLFAPIFAAGCTPPPPVAKNGPPTPPPAPVAVEKPPASPPPVVEKKAAPDPYEKLIAEVSGLVDRYVAILGTIRDEATAEKGAEQIGQLSARLRQL